MSSAIWRIVFDSPTMACMVGYASEERAVFFEEAKGAVPCTFTKFREFAIAGVRGFWVVDGKAIAWCDLGEAYWVPRRA